MRLHPLRTPSGGGGGAPAEVPARAAARGSQSGHERMDGLHRTQFRTHHLTPAPRAAAGCRRS